MLSFYLKMEGVKSKSKSSKKLIKKPVRPITSFKKALASSISKSKKKTKKGAKNFPVKANSSHTKQRPPRGTVYISHLPHGFYEAEIKDYFTQFGIVTGVNLPRSKRSGRSRGYAFVQFLNKEVAKIAAQTMNKYLMINRIIEARLLTSRECQSLKFTPAKPITPETCEKAMNRKKYIGQRNWGHSRSQHERMVREEQGKLQNTQKKLAELGIPEVEL